MKEVSEPRGEATNEGAGEGGRKVSDLPPQEDEEAEDYHAQDQSHNHSAQPLHVLTRHRMTLSSQHTMDFVR